ncbi:MAG: 3-phosphoshikimate 1-carboxyvinyltransferase, partial [Calditrichia bacterium]
MDKKIPTGKLCGTIAAPPSKSMTHRMLVMAALSGKECRIKNPLFCEDTEITINALRKLGFQFEVYEKEIFFSGRKNDPAGVPTIYVGNSGTSARFLTALAAVLGIDCLIDGEGRMRQRPMAPLIRALQELGAKLEHRHGQL